MRSFCSRLGLLGLASGLVTLMSCSEPTGQNRDPSFATTTTYLTISGPTVVTQPTVRSYTWQAYMAASYPNFYPWGYRVCPSAKGACTSAWTTAYGSAGSSPNYNLLTLGVSENCGGGETMVLQLRAQASAFAVPTQTAYFNFRLCRGV